MIRRDSLFALAVYLFLVLLSPALVHAQSGLAVLDSSAQIEFPSQLHFSLSAQSDTNITDIRLRYTVDRASFADVTSETYIEFVPSARVDISWTLEMVKIGGLPPGSSLRYWWVVEDAGGKKMETPPASLQFEDNRYSWRSLTEGKVTIYWYKGEESFARKLIASTQEVLTELAGDTGARLGEPIRMYVYASTQDLRGAMIYPQEWTGGVTFSRHGVIAIGIAPDELDWGKRAIAHELTHVVIHQMTFNPYSGLPTWLDEGLAMYAEGPLEAGYAALLNKAITEQSLISVRSLSSPFSAYAKQSYLAYAQSYSLVEFLIDDYGQGKMLELLNTFKQGSSYDGALNRVYGFDMDGLEALWQNRLALSSRQPAERAQVRLASAGNMAALAEKMAVLAGIFFIGLGAIMAYTARSKHW